MNRARYSLLAILCVAAPRVSADDQCQDVKHREQAVRRYLAVKYDDVDHLSDRQIIYGPAYNSKAPLKRVVVDELAQALPSTTFFRTTLDTNEYEYPKLEVIVAITKADRNYIIRSCVSPTFTTPPRRLLGLIRGQEATSDEHRVLAVWGPSAVRAAS